MAATISTAVGSRTGPQVPGSRRRVLFTLTGDTSYPTGGYTVSAASLGLQAIDAVLVSGSADVTGTWIPVWTGSKVKLFSALGTEVASTTDVHTAVVTCEALGI